MAVTATTALLIGAAASLGGTALQARAANRESKFQSAIQRQQADRERQIAAANEEDFRRQQSRLQAASRAAQGASGTQTGTGSSLLVSEDFAAETELQALRLRAGGETRATRLEQQATLTRRAGRSTARSGLLGGIGRTSLLVADSPLVP